MGKDDFTIEANASTTSVFGLTDLLAVVRKHWMSGAFIGLVVAGLFVASVLTKEKLYQASASMTVELTTANVMDIREVMDTNVAHVNLLNTLMNTHLERIKTRAIADAVVAALSEDQIQQLVDPYYDPAIDGENKPDPAVLLMRRMLSVERGENEESQVLNIIITHQNPRIAQQVANTYVDEYIAYKAGLRSSSTGEAVNFLERQVAEMREELELQEVELQDYRQQHNLVSVQQDKGITADRLARLNDALTDAEIRQLSVETRQRQIAAADGVIDRLMEIPYIGERDAVNAVYAQLSELKRERLVLDERYLRKHPKIVENEAAMKSVSTELSRAIRQAEQQSTIEYQTVQKEVSDLTARIQETEGRVLVAERSLLEYKRMERDVDQKREMFNKLMNRYRETRIAQQMNLNNMLVLDRANLPMQPLTMSRTQMVAAAIVLGAVFLVGCPLVIELIDGRLTSFQDVEQGSHKALLGDVRFYGQKKGDAVYQAVLQKDADLLESFRSIYSSIRMRADLSAKRKASFVITSSVPNEGKSMVACNLSAVIAKHNYRVLLVDCDLRNPSLHRAHGVEDDAGLCPWFDSGSTDMEDLLGNESLGILKLSPSLSLLRAGGGCEHPTELLGDLRVSALFSKLKDLYDIVVFDTPIGLFSDATIVADSADSCVMVARQFAVKRTKFQHSVNQMERSTAPVVGVVFNGIKDVNAAVGFGRNGVSHYGYGYEKDPEKYKAYYRRSRSA